MEGESKGGSTSCRRPVTYRFQLSKLEDKPYILGTSGEAEAGSLMVVPRVGVAGDL